MFFGFQKVDLHNRCIKKLKPERTTRYLMPANTSKIVMILYVVNKMAEVKEMTNRAKFIGEKDLL